MNLTLLGYALYLGISIALTVWVARTLHRNGRVFLIDAFHGRVEMADAVNHLLVVGFYLINLGFVTLALRYGRPPTTWENVFVYVSTKVGLAMLVLGAMHFFNLFNLDKMRRKAKRSDVAAAAALPAH
ncbi:hypothetical protein [Synoicihabitans lomoniglobus]|uniref:Uncharacterized protein n=1 Tax=Synoicihabitans lomoniglobus TaxID=2909285 RepID=A0AAE9ZWI8_9BACT|nr:hypothetical protein [Opitutaceae bacterium LMO-M01]WED64494.1 hypothetical protein PXH66_19310 [Opitutaceae bacterium LMO-M01]